MKPKVLAFDVFGTVVDWHGSITAELTSLIPEIDAISFTSRWRSGYKPAMARVRSGSLGGPELMIYTASSSTKF